MGGNVEQKAIKSFETAYITAREELLKIIKSGRKDVACKVLMDAMNGLIEIGKEGHPEWYGKGFISDKEVTQEQKLLFKRLKKAEGSMIEMHNALVDMYECKLIDKMKKNALWSAQQFLYELMGLF